MTVSKSAVRVVLAHPYRHPGGPDIFIANIVRATSKRGVVFWAVLPEERRFCQTLRQLGVTVMIEPALEMLPRTFSPGRLLRHFHRAKYAARRIRQLTREHDIRVVHAIHETSWTVLRAIGPRGPKRVLSVHGLRFTSPPWIGSANARFLSRHTDAVICVSEAVRQALRRFQVPEAHLRLVRSSVDLDRFRCDVSREAFRRAVGVPMDVPLIGTVGSLDERKGLTYFIDACAHLRKTHAKMRAVVVGAPPIEGDDSQSRYVRQLRAQVAALNLDDQVTFVPATDDIPAVMAALDVLVQPSLTEAGPRAPLEAMAVGTPVVGTDLEGNREEVVHDETGVLVPARDSNALAHAIAALIDDSARRARLGRAGRERIEKLYSLETTADIVLAIYREMSNAARR